MYSGEYNDVAGGVSCNNVTRGKPSRRGGGGFCWVGRYHRECSDIGDYILHSPGASDGYYHLPLLRVCSHIVGRLMLTPRRTHLGKVQMVVYTA